VLPYNLNWMRKNFDWFRAFLEKNPITFFDIGARGGFRQEKVLHNQEFGLAELGVAGGVTAHHVEGAGPVVKEIG